MLGVFSAREVWVNECEGASVRLQALALTSFTSVKAVATTDCLVGAKKGERKFFGDESKKRTVRKPTVTVALQQMA